MATQDNDGSLVLNGEVRAASSLTKEEMRAVIPAIEARASVDHPAQVFASAIAFRKVNEWIGRFAEEWARVEGSLFDVNAQDAKPSERKAPLGVVKVVDRATSAGRLIVVMDCDDVTGSLAGRALHGTVRELASPARLHDGRLASAVLDNEIALFEDEYRAILNIQKPFEERASFAARSDCGDAFPGSKEYRRAQFAQADLESFDADHPEVRAALDARLERDAKARNTLPWI